jgi:hypothetical protein
MAIWELIGQASLVPAGTQATSPFRFDRGSHLFQLLHATLSVLTAAAALAVVLAETWPARAAEATASA